MYIIIIVICLKKYVSYRYQKCFVTPTVFWIQIFMNHIISPTRVKFQYEKVFYSTIVHSLSWLLWHILIIDLCFELAPVVLIMTGILQYINFSTIHEEICLFSKCKIAFDKLQMALLWHVKDHSNVGSVQYWCFMRWY